MTNRMMSMVAVCGLVMGVAAEVGNIVRRPIDDAKFILDLRPEQVSNGRLTKASVGDRLRWGSRDTAYGEENTHVGDPVAIRREWLPRNMYPMTTNCVSYLYFPQTSSSWIDANDGHEVVQQSSNRILFPDVPLSGGTLTAHIRFRWDGFVQTNKASNCILFMAGYDWSDASGLSMYIYNPGNGATTGELYVGIGRGSNASGLTVRPSRWYDLFITLRPLATDATKTEFILRALVHPGTSGYNETYRKYNKPNLVSWAPKTHSARLTFSANHAELKLATEQDYSGWSRSDSTGTAAPFNTFRGAIAELELWERELDVEECWQVLSGSDGAIWSVGSVNGSEDEFATEDPGADYAVTNGWRFCRRELTAARPTLRLRGPMSAEDAATGHLLEIVPILDAAGASCPYRLTVCGNVVGTYNLARPAGRCVYVPADLWVRDSNGDVTVEIERTGTVEGTVRLDAITLGGSWTMGLANNACEGTSAGYVSPRFVAGDPDPEWHRQRALSGDANASTETIFFHMPYEAANWEWGCALEVRTDNMGTGLVGNMDLALYLNGQEVDVKTGFGKYSVVTFAVPPELFVPGINAATISNATPAAVSDNWCNLDYVRMVFQDRPKIPQGSVLTIR